MSMATVDAVNMFSEFGEVISGTVAREIASYWQSSGSVGHVLASFASGHMVSPVSLQNDVIKTIRDARKDDTSEENLIELYALLAYTKRH